MKHFGSPSWVRISWGMVMLAGLVYVAFMSRYVIAMTDQFYQQGDLSAYDHVIYMLGQGKPFWSSLCGSVISWWPTAGAPAGGPYPAVPSDFNSLGIHFIAGLALTNLPFEFLFSGVNTTLISQTLAFALSAVLLFWLLLLRGLPLGLCLVLAVSFLIHPANLGANVNAFHPVIMALPVLLGMMVALEKKAWKTYFALAIVALLIQENISIVVAAMTLPLLFARQWKVAALNMTAALVGFVATTQWLIPAFNSNHVCPYCGIYGSPLGASIGEIIKNGLLNPGLLFSTVFRAEILTWIEKLLRPTVWLAVFSPQNFLVALAGVAPNILSNNHAMHILWGQYNALAMPFLYTGAGTAAFSLVSLAGSRGLRVRRATVWVLAILICYASMRASNSLAELPLTRFAAIFTTKPLEFNAPDFRKAAEDVVAAIPAGASVSAPEGIMPKIHRRAEAYFFPVHHLKADYVVVPKQAYFISLNEVLRFRQEALAAGYLEDVDNAFFTLLRNPKAARRSSSVTAIEP